MKKHIPNTLTCCNLLSGAVAVWLATEHLYICALGMIIVGALFDFCDGLSARALNVSSPIGKELDSLADDITFGLAPAMMLFCFLKPIVGYWALIALLMAAFSALRLAKFNLDERQTSDFIGLATPANALFWGCLTASFRYLPLPHNTLTAGFLLTLSLLSCYLLVSEIPFFSLKFHDMTWAHNRTRYIFLIGSVLILLAVLLTAALTGIWVWFIPSGAVIIVWYILLALTTLNHTNNS